jgi:hypothetical protein
MIYGGNGRGRDLNLQNLLSFTIDKYGKNGANTTNVVRELIETYLPDPTLSIVNNGRPLQLKYKIVENRWDEKFVKNVLLKQHGKLVCGFYLQEHQWNHFSAFFKKSPGELYSDLPPHRPHGGRKKGDGGHAVVITGI